MRATPWPQIAQPSRPQMTAKLSKNTRCRSLASACGHDDKCLGLPRSASPRQSAPMTLASVRIRVMGGHFGAKCRAPHGPDCGKFPLPGDPPGRPLSGLGPRTLSKFDGVSNASKHLLCELLCSCLGMTTAMQTAFYMFRVRQLWELVAFYPAWRGQLAFTLQAWFM